MLLQPVFPSAAPKGRDQLPAVEGAPRGSVRPVRMDRIDRMIVAELQRDAALPLVRLADRVELSQTPCWKRIRKLEEAGVITRRVALVDPQEAGLGLTAFIAVAAVDHSPTWRGAFAEAMATLPEVIEVWRMAGDVDYLLKVVARGRAAFNAFDHRLIGALELNVVTSQFAMERVA